MHVCPIESCLKTFTRKANLDGHINAHFGSQPYQCSHCPTKFTRENDRRAHEREQHGCATTIQIFQCHACGANFPRKSTLLRHQSLSKGSLKCGRSHIQHKSQVSDRTESARGQASLVLRCNSSPARRSQIKCTSLALPGTSLTTYNTNTDSLCDWTGIAFASALDAVTAIFGLYTLEDPRGPRYTGDKRIDFVYGELMRTTIPMITRGPLQLVIPTIFSLMILDVLRDNDTASDTLADIGGTFSDRELRMANLSNFSPLSVGFPMLFDASKRFLARFSELLVRETDLDENTWCGFQMTCWFCACAMASFFITWTQTCIMQGFCAQAASCRSLYQAFESLRRRRFPFMVDLVGDLEPSLPDNWVRNLEQSIKF